MAEQTTYTTEQIMEQAQVFASAWSLVGGPFDSGDGLERAEQEKDELAAMVAAHATPQPTELPCEFAPEFRRALLWLLWNHQGGKSQVGQPIRAMLGIGQHDHLTDEDIAEAKAYRESPPLWAVHAQSPDELWAAESREDAEQHAAALNALPGQTDTIKVNAVVIPSPWSEVEHWKTLAEQWRDEAEDRIASLQGLSKRVEKLEADHNLLLSTDMAKTLDIIAIGEALGIPGEEQQGGIAEFIEAIETLRNDAAVAAIQYAIENSDEEPIQFLRCWYHGDFDAIRQEWNDVPDEVFIGADPLFAAGKEAADA